MNTPILKLNRMELKKMLLQSVVELDGRQNVSRQNGFRQNDMLLANS